MKSLLNSEIICEARCEMTDCLTSIFELDLKSPVLIWIGGFSLGTISSFVDNWIFEPSVSYLALLILIGCDHVTGALWAYKNGTFESKKFGRIIYTLLSHTALLFFATQLSKGSAALFFLNEAVFVPLVLVNLISLIKNLSLLGYIKKGFVTLFYKKIDKFKDNIVEKASSNTDSGASD